MSGWWTDTHLSRRADVPILFHVRGRMAPYRSPQYSNIDKMGHGFSTRSFGRDTVVARCHDTLEVLNNTGIQVPLSTISRYHRFLFVSYSLISGSLGALVARILCVFLDLCFHRFLCTLNLRVHRFLSFIFIYFKLWNIWRSELLCLSIFVSADISITFNLTNL